MHFVKVFLGPSGWGVTFANYMLYMLVWGSSMPVVMCVCVCPQFRIAATRPRKVKFCGVV